MNDDTAVLEVQHLTHNFGEKYVLFDLNFQILAGEFVALVGPSGCGKSTLLRALLGTHPANEGQVIEYMGSGKRNPIEVRKPSRERGIVYQRYSLYPDRTALENVAFGLLLDESSIPDRLLRWVPFQRERHGKKIPWKQLRRIHLREAEALLVKLHLEDAMRKYPHQLSGGMCQRVAIAQALIMKPRILLLDEPFGALDEATREEMQIMLLELYSENMKALQDGQPAPYTILFVTHELNEAILVGDRVLGLSQYWDSPNHGDPRAVKAATIVYDEVAPVFLPESEKDFNTFKAQRDNIRHFVFDPTVLQQREDLIRFWDQVQDGKGQGVLENGSPRK